MNLQPSNWLSEFDDRSIATHCRTRQIDRAWVENAIEIIRSDFHRSGETHLFSLNLDAFPNTTFYLKDESAHPSGSLKHRLARSLFLYGICDGKIGDQTPIVECSSGSTAISEAYFARLLGLPFHAVIPHSTAPRKIREIEFFGGVCHKVEPIDIYAYAEDLADRLGGHYMDQFENAERVTDWRGNNNIAESLFQQMMLEKTPVPDWVVVGAGTGGTSATIGRYIRYEPHLLKTCRLCVVDPERSVFFDAFKTGRTDITASQPSRIEGIGRPRVEASFVPDVIDRMVRVEDAKSIAAMVWLSRLLNRPCGASTGTNMIAALALARGLEETQGGGAIATLICDGGSRYKETYYSEEWRQSEGLHINAELERLEALHASLIS